MRLSDVARARSLIVCGASKVASLLEDRQSLLEAGLVFSRSHLSQLPGVGRLPAPCRIVMRPIQYFCPVYSIIARSDRPNRSE